MTQEEAILHRLEMGETITPLDALREVGSFRLGARIWDLKKKGHNIEKISVKTTGGAVVAGYRFPRIVDPSGQGVMFA